MNIMTSDIQVKQDIKSLLDSEALKRSLEKSFSSESKRVAFRTSVLSLVNTNAKIAECEPFSVINSCLQASTLDLPINQNLGFAYIIPYKQKDGSMVAQFQMGVKGFVQLAIRTGLFKRINTSDVKEGELKTHDRLSGEFEFSWIADEQKRNDSKIVGFISYFKLISGFEAMLYMSVDQLDQHAFKYSQTYKSEKSWIRDSSKWVTDFDAMAKKTVLKLLLSRSAPLSVELQKAIEYDQAVFDNKAEVTYPDNQEETLEQRNRRVERERILEFINDAKTLEKLESLHDQVSPDDDIVTEEIRNAYEAKEKELKGGKK